LNYVLIFVICAIMITFRYQIVGIYNLSPEANETAAQMLLAHSMAMVLWPLSFTITHALRASNDAAFTMYVSVGSMWLFRIGFAYLFVVVLKVGVLGVWYGMFIDWVFRTLVFMRRFHGFGTRRK